MKVYGSKICIDCRNFKHICELRGLSVDSVDITENTKNLKEYMLLRDTDPFFDDIKKAKKLGIPLFMNDDGTLTTNPDEALAWIGQPPVRDEEIAERRFACESCS